ncbi:MAG: ATP-binding protein, partial [Myxococcota bacterium]
AYVPVIFENGKVMAVLGVSASVSHFETLNSIRNGIVLIIVFSLGLIILIITIVSRGISLPISDMIEQAKEIARGRFEKSLRTKTYGELAILVDTLEMMRDRIMNRDKEMQMMLSGIAHEIRNPLGGMQIMIDLLSEKYKDDSEATNLINQVNSELKYLNNVVTSFLKYSRNISIEKQKVNLESVINEVVENLSYEIEKRGIVILKELQEIEIMSDYDILRQIFTNILLNAIQAIENSGWIEIKISCDKKMAVVTFKDNGSGIKPEDLNMVFRPFFTTKEKGSGLGLALVKRYLLHLGGDIQIESEYLKGCEVRIYLPLL